MTDELDAVSLYRIWKQYYMGSCKITVLIDLESTTLSKMSDINSLFMRSGDFHTPLARYKR
ncbi:hypothetical protein VHTUMSATKI_22740 [Vibrio harveyi]